MRRLLLLVALTAACGLRAAPLERDLGAGLVYFRAHRLPADLPPGQAVAGKCVVLDIRFVAGGRGEGASLLGWLRSHASVRRPVFLLANDETSGALLDPLDSPTAVSGLLILGPDAPGFSPDIGLKETPGTDERAYRALDRGATVASLTDDVPVKTRQDEAMLAREHLPDSALGDADADPQTEPKPVGPPPLIDAVLQRAIQVHRALLALRRID